MKTIFTSLLLLLVVNLSANELKWVDEQIEAIKPPRQGLQSKELAKIKNPFIFLPTVKSKSTKQYRKSKYAKSSKKKKHAVVHNKFHLTITMNKTARINDKWYKLGDIISGYKITKIDSSSVLLTKNKKKFLLSTHSKNRNLNFKN